MSAEGLRKTAGRPSERAAGARVAALFEEHGRMVYGVCRLLLPDREEAEDATQQTFLSAYRSLLGGTEPEEPAAWLGTIARNECRGRMRARAAAPLALVEEAAEPTDDVETTAHQHEEVAALVDMLAELPQHQREAMVLREFYGLSHEEVGHALGVSPSAVDSLLVRARRRLQTALRPARLASGALVLPLALRESLAQAMPGFATAGGGGGVFAKLVSLPIAAKLTATAATVGAVGVVAGAQPPAPPVAAKQAPPTPVEAARPELRAPTMPPAPPPEPPPARPIAAVTDGEDGADEGRGHHASRNQAERQDDEDDAKDEQQREERRENQRQDENEGDADEPDADDGEKDSGESGDSDDSGDSGGEEESGDGED